MSKRILEEKNQEMLVAGAYLNFFFISREKTFNNWAPRPLSKKVAAKKVEMSKLKKKRFILVTNYLSEISKRILEEKNQEILVVGAYFNFFFTSRDKTFNSWAQRTVSKKVIVYEIIRL